MAVLAAAAVLWLRPSTDLGPWRRDAEQRLTLALGRPVSIGQAHLQWGLQPRLSLRDIRIANAPGFSAEPLLSVEEAVISVDPAAALRAHYTVETARLSGVRLSLETRSAGPGEPPRNNWTLKPKASVEPDARKAFLAALPLELLSKLVVNEARVQRLRVSYQADGTPRRAWQLADAMLRAPEDAPLVFEADGRCEKEDCVLRWDAAPLSALAQVAAGRQAGWPVRVNTRRGARVAALAGELRLDSLQGHLAVAVPQARQDLATWGVTLGRGKPEDAPLAAAFAANLSVTTRGLQANDLRLHLGDASVSGKVSMTFGGRPQLGAELALAGWDRTLEDLLGETPRQPAIARRASEPPARLGLRRLHQSLSAVEVDFGFLAQMDASVRLSMPRFHALGLIADDASLHVQLLNGQLSAPLRVRLWDTPFTADLNAVVDDTARTTAWRLVMQSRQLDAGQLAREAMGLKQVTGRAAEMLVSLDASGRRLSDWLATLDMVLLLRDARLGLRQQDRASSAERQALIRQLVVRWAGAQPLAGALNAEVLGHPLLATLSGNALEDILRHERLSLGLSMRSEDVTLDASASVRDLGHAHPRAEVVWLDLKAPRASAVAGWFGLNTRADIPLSLRALAQPLGDDWVSPWRLQAGDTVIHATATHPLGSRSAASSLAIHIPRLHVADIDALLPQDGQPRPPTEAKASAPRREPLRPPGPKAKPDREQPGAPLGRSFSGRLSVQVDELAGSRVPVASLRVSGDWRESAMLEAPLTATIDGQPLTGQLGLSLRGPQPMAQLRLRMAQPDLGRLARRLGLNPAFELRFDDITLDMQAQAANLADLPARTSFVANVRGGRFSLRDGALGRTYAVELVQGQLSAEAGQPVRATLSARTLSSPEGADAPQTATLALQSGSLPLLLNTSDPVPLRARVDLGSHHVEIDALAGRTAGDIALRSQPPVQVRLSAGGQRLDELNRAVGVALPPWGPWRLESRLDSGPGEHRLRDLRLQVGSSTVEGTASWIERPQQRPVLSADLRSPRIVLADFPRSGWSAWRQVTDSEATASTPLSGAGTDSRGVSASQQIATQASRAAQAGDALLATATLGRQDATVKLQVDSVVLGGAGPERDVRLGGGMLQAVLRDGDLSVGPALLGLPGGTASFALSFAKAQAPPAAAATRRLAQLRLDVPRFDYSSLARWYAPVALRESRGELSLSAHASATVSELAELPALGRGEVRARLYPQALSSQRIDIWAVNLLTALLPAVDPSAGPKVNCVVAELSLGDGHLRHRRLALDTTAMRVTGEGHVHLTAQKGADAYALRFQPQAKEAQFFSLATPVGVSGPLLQPRVGVSAGDVAATAMRLATSWVWVPLQRLAGQRLPADGADLCGR
jgi:uncharacterized protein involved in outer membrane biogenesis